MTGFGVAPALGGDAAVFRAAVRSVPPAGVDARAMPLRGHRLVTVASPGSLPSGRQAHGLVAFGFLEPGFLSTGSAAA